MGLVLGTEMSPRQMAERVAATAAGKQHRLAAYLVDGRHEINPAQYAGIMRHLEGCPDLGATREEDMGRARTVTDAEAVARATISDIPAGFYATPSRTGSNDLDFWKVRVSEKSGFRSVARVVGGGDARTPRLIEIGKQEQRAALGAILRTGIREAQEEYADKEERCMKCGRQLTDDDSRARRMGDWCASKE